MSVWALVLLGVDLLLMGAIIYLLLNPGNLPANSIVRSLMKRDAVKEAPGAGVITELTEELSRVKKFAAELEKKQKDLDIHGRVLAEQDRKLDRLISEASKPAKKMDAGTPAHGNEELYSKATRMMKAGIPVEEVIRSLGIMRGEAELLSTLSGMRS